MAAAFAFGVLLALAKGTGGEGISEVRNVFGNLSAPWLLVAFLAGTRCSTRRSGALLGLGATILALLGFYLLSSLVQDLGHHGFFADLRLELSANRGYVEGGIITGPLFGALGMWWRQSRKLRAPIVAGIVLMAEPLVLFALGTFAPGGVLPAESGLPLVVRLVPGWGLSADSSAVAIAVYTAEFMLGLGAVLLARRRHVPRQAL